MQGSIPIQRVNDGLGNIPSHGGKVDLHLGQGFGITADPSHTLAIRLGSRDIERGAGGVESGYLKAAIGQQEGESACSATDIQNAISTELLRDSDVYIEVAPVGVERVIDPGQPRMLEYRISYAANNGRKFEKYLGSPPFRSRSWRSEGQSGRGITVS
jgi:hypothetical protein